MRKKASSVIPKKVGMIRVTRVSRKRSIGSPGNVGCAGPRRIGHPAQRTRLRMQNGGAALAAPPKPQGHPSIALDVDAVERVACEGRELEVNDFLPDRLQLNS